MTRETSTLITAIARAADEPTRGRLLRDGARAALSRPADAVAIAAAVLAPADDEEGEAAAALLSCALDEARMAAENGAPEGEALIGAVAEALAEADAASPLAPQTRLRLAQIHARAGLAAPPCAVLTPDVMADAGGSDGEAPEIGALLDPILKEVGDAPLQAHAAVSDLLAGVPSELAEMLVSLAVARPGSMEARLGLYWLLDPKPGIRLAAATALLSRAEAGTLGAELAALLPAIRKWLPDDPARAALDAVIRRRMRDGGAPAAPPRARIHRTAASLPDGAGAQSLIAAVQVGGRRGVAMAMLKQGHGVKDAFVIPCASATEQRCVLARILDEIETFDVGPDALAEALARGLGEGLALGLLPAPGLVDWAELWGPDALIPARGDAPAILAALGAPDALEELSAAKRGALLKASAGWMVRFEQSDAWFEDTADLRAAIGRARTEQGRETAVWKRLERRRDWWARQFAVSAAVLKTSGETAEWLSFAAVAQALLDGRSAKRIPIMADIVELTLAASDAREGGPSSRAEGGGAGSLLADGGIGEAYLQGYLAALALAPQAPTSQEWLGPLLGGIEFPGEGSVERLLQFVMERANRIDEDAGDAKIVAGWLAALDSEGLEDWAAGFDDLVSATRRSWSPRALAAADKRVLRDIKAVAKGHDGSALRTVLPSWTAMRHALRR